MLYPAGLRAWQQRLDADCVGHSHHSLGSNNFRKVLLRSRLLVPWGQRHSQSFKYLGQPRITPLSGPAAGGHRRILREADPGGGGGLALASGWCFFEDFSIRLLQEGLPCGKGGAAAWALREPRAAARGARWVGDSQGGPCFPVKVLLCVSAMCSLAHWPSAVGGPTQALPGASWHPLLLWLFWALAVFRLGEGWVILPKPGMLGRCLDRHSRVQDLCSP